MNNKTEALKYKKTFNVLFISMWTLYITINMILDTWSVFDLALISGVYLSVGSIIYTTGKGNKKLNLTAIFLAAVMQGLWVGKTLFAI